MNEIEQTMDGVEDEIPIILESAESNEYDFIIETVRNIKQKSNTIQAIKNITLKKNFDNNQLS
jgi:hypothetical protein